MTIASRQQTISSTGGGLRRTFGVAALFMAATLSSCSSVGTTNTVALTGKPQAAHMTVARNETTPRIFGYSTPVKLSQTGSVQALPEPLVKPRRTASLGSSPYICSPSGFGRRSTCFLR